VEAQPIILALRRQKQEDHEFKVNLDYIARPCLQKKKRVVGGMLQSSACAKHCFPQDCLSPFHR
jgi:hypothetical protein